MLVWTCGLCSYLPVLPLIFTIFSTNKHFSRHRIPIFLGCCCCCFRGFGGGRGLTSAVFVHFFSLACCALVFWPSRFQTACAVDSLLSCTHLGLVRLHQASRLCLCKEPHSCLPSFSSFSHHSHHLSAASFTRPFAFPFSVWTGPTCLSLNYSYSPFSW